MIKGIVIRQEQPADYREVENLTREAFWNVYRPGCTEHYVLNQYRNNPDFIPELDLVMEENGKHPDYKRKGYGLQLLNHALNKARTLGVGFLCMEGNIEFYRHAGFGLASQLGIHYHAEPRDAVVPYFLAQELLPGWLESHGIKEATYTPPKGYFVADNNPEAFEAYEATFPPKEKLRLPGQLDMNVLTC